MREHNVKRQGYSTRLLCILGSAMLALSTLSSCVMDDGNCPTQENGAEYGINLSIAAGAISTRNSGHPDTPGTADEKYINVATEDFAIFIFDQNGNFVERFWPTYSSDDNGVYHVFGVFRPDAKNPPEKIQLAVMVNGRSVKAKYPLDSDLKEKTLNDIYDNGTDFNFTLPTTTDGGHTVSWSPSAANSRGIPMFGLSGELELENLRDIFSEVYNEIPALRSVAKIEICDKVPGVPANIERCVLTSYTSNGRFIPDGINNPNWKAENSQVEKPSMPSAAATGTNLQFVKLSNQSVEIDGKTELRDCFVAYIPEMNLNGLKVSDDNRPVIEVYVEGGTKPYIIELSEYGTDGKPKPKEGNSTEYEFYDALLRNHVYRYNIKAIGVDTELVITTADWDLDGDQIWHYEDVRTDGPEDFVWKDFEGNDWSEWDNSNTDDQLRILLIGNSESEAAYGSFTLAGGENSPANWTISLIPDDDTKNDHFKIEVKSASGTWESQGEKGDFYTAAVDGTQPVEFRIIATAQNTGLSAYTARVVMTLTTFDGRVSNLKLTNAGDSDPADDKYYYQVKQESNGGDNM